MNLSSIKLMSFVSFEDFHWWTYCVTNISNAIHLHTYERVLTIASVRFVKAVIIQSIFVSSGVC